MTTKHGGANDCSVTSKERRDHEVKKCPSSGRKRQKQGGEKTISGQHGRRGRSGGDKFLAALYGVDGEGGIQITLAAISKQ